MGWVKDALSELAAGRTAQVRPFGGSMRGRIESRQLVTLAPVRAGEVRPHDVVLVRWHGNYLLHLLKETRDGRLLIGNNLGKINGWVSGADVVAKVVAVGEALSGPTQAGVVEEVGPGLTCRVRLAGGAPVVTTVPRRTARERFRIVAGDRVQVSGPVDGKYRVIGLARYAAETVAAPDRAGGN
jgi:translation initiation factor IF-1